MQGQVPQSTVTVDGDVCPLGPNEKATSKSVGNHGAPADIKSKSRPEADDIKTESAKEWIEGIPLVMVISGVTLVVLLMLLDTSIVSTAIPQITSDFHSLEDVGWYGSAYTIASSALQTLTGKVYTYFKSKWSFLFFFFIFEVGSLICGLATSSTMLILGRAVAGMGSSGMMNGALNIVAGAVPMHRRPVMLGIIMGISQLGLVCGPLLGGAFTTKSTWRWCFYVNLPIGGLVALLLVFTRVPEQQVKGRTLEVWRSLSLVRNFDLVGFAFFAGASIQLLLALQYGGNQYAWDSATVIGLFCGSAATFAVLVIWERHMGEDAMLPAHLISQPIIWCSCLLAMMIFGMTMNLSFYLPVYFQAVRGASALDSGVDLLPNILCQLVMAVISGILTSKLGYYLPWGVFGAVLNAVGNGLLSTLSPTTSVPVWAGYQSLVGFGRGAAAQVPLIAIQNVVSPSEMSTAMAIMTFCQTFGAAIFLAVAEALFSRALRVNLAQYAPAVDADLVVAAGATGFRDVVSPPDLPAVLVAYSKSVSWVFYLNIGICAAQFALSWGVGWKNVKKSKRDKDTNTDADPA